MSEQWVVNASPLILLARIGREDLLRTLPKRVAIPRARRYRDQRWLAR